MYTLRMSRFADAGKFPFALHEASDQQAGFPMHAHDYTELAIVRSGSGTHVTEEEEYPLNAGDVFVIEKGQSHCYRNINKLKVSNLLLDLSRLPLPLEYLAELSGFHALFSVEPMLRKKHGFKSRLKLSADQLGKVNLMLSRLRTELWTRNPGYKVFAIGILTELLAFLSNCYVNRQHEGESLEVARLGEVIEKIERDFNAEISLDELASIAHMSKRTLLRYFNSVFGVSPISYLLKVRLDNACSMLLNTDRQIDEIATESGFLDGNYFSRHFKKAKGMSPRLFRNRFKQANVP